MWYFAWILPFYLRLIPTFIGLKNSSCLTSALILVDRRKHSGTLWMFAGPSNGTLRGRPRSEALLVSFHPASVGMKVLASTVGRWLKACISKAYELKAKPLPGRVLPHSTRSAATTAAWVTQASVEDICRADSWSSLSSCKPLQIRYLCLC